MNAEYDRIMSQIRSGLTGDTREDISYLHQQMEQYRDHDLGREIVKECARMVYRMLPENVLGKVNEAILKDQDNIRQNLSNVRRLISQKKYDEALVRMEKTVADCEQMSGLVGDKISEFHNFTEPFEEVLYRYRYRPERKIRECPLPLVEVYLQYGSLLIDMKRLPEARNALRKGMWWNPVCFHLWSEYIETFKVEGELDLFFQLSLAAFRIVFRREDAARLYRNLAFYFIEKELYTEAILCHQMSMEYVGDNRMSQNELAYIAVVSGGRARQPEGEEIKEISSRYGIPLFSNKEILYLAVGTGIDAQKHGDKEAADYFFEVGRKFCYPPMLWETFEKYIPD